MTEPGVFEWTSPHGHRYRRDRHGTTAIDRPAPPDPPGIPRPTATMTPPHTPPPTR